MIQEEYHDELQTYEINNTNTEDLKEFPADFNKEEIQWQKEQMKERIRYMNKHYKNFRK